MLAADGVADVMLPVLDSWGVLERVQSTGPRPPVLVASAKGAPSDVARSLELGAADVPAKPFESEELLARVGALLAPRRAGGAGRADCPEWGTAT